MGSASASRLRIALLGFDSQSPSVARALLANHLFQVAGLCEWENAPRDPPFASLRPGLASAKPLDSWEALLDPDSFDAVVVARGENEDVRTEQLRKLIQIGIPLLVTHPVVDSMLVYYELDMIRRETDCIVAPMLSERHHPAIQRLAAMVGQGAASPIGKIEQVTIERCLAQPAMTDIVSQFARDVDLVRCIAGEMTRLGAMAGASGEGTLGSLGVHMSGPGGIVARWSVVPIQMAQGARLTLIGSNGKAVVELRPQAEPWTLELSIGGQTHSQRYEPWNAAAVAIETLASALRGEPTEPNWIDAARSIELAETIPRSLKKSRTIELHYEDYTEEGTFKGAMTSVGCGLLLLAMFSLFVVAIAEQAGVPYVRHWPYAMVGVLGIFLLLQLLKMAASPQEKDGADATPADTFSRPPS